jgi:voltage-dependent potassium channel beta subunit
MEYRRLGKSGLQVSLLSFGSWITFGNQIENKTSENLMAMAYDHGINFFDNAEIYANGKSEEVMGQLLTKLKWDRTSYLVSSKVFFGDGRKKPNQTGLNRKHIFEACHAALKRLQVDYLDLFFCHRPDKNTPMEETVWAMNHLIQQGKILYWGTSEWSAMEIMEAHMISEKYRLIGPTMEQPQYNMFHREKMENEYLKIFNTVGLGTTIWSPLASGLLSKKYISGIPSDSRLSREELSWLKDSIVTEQRLAKVKEMNKLAENLDTTLPKLAIAWCAKNKNVSTVILGASKEAQLKETLSALELLPLFTEEVNLKIESILQTKPILPSF